MGIIWIPGEWILVDLGSVGDLSRLLTLSFFEIMLKPFFRWSPSIRFSSLFFNWRARWIFSDFHSTAGLNSLIPMIFQQLSDTRLAQRLCGWAPWISLVDGLKETIEWYRRNLFRFKVGSYSVMKRCNPLSTLIEIGPIGVIYLFDKCRKGKNGWTTKS